ncbi:Thioredoxin H-type 9, H9,TH9 [Hibiscus syriacus]|uniref:Thioredoxin H-type 9, H9,TH9 n=1 Tax=Hibiscus syriacus TaxID=106335 RepID=A0A6A2ZVA4_HIBSY|nr:basal body-orientation factor 1-like [Hibiscus syriacus]KAE8695506.1 Thioredoxin H-type 9, H9,TH9 [Hibiscus syriacus]
MEDDKKKKKRNKKNKNKQIKSAEEDLDRNNNNNVSNSQNIHITELDLEPDTHRRNSAIPSSAEDMIKKLQKETESHIEKEATLQETIQHLQKENESYIQMQVTLEETIYQLRNECDSHLKKEASLEESILKLQLINNSHLQKEASLKETVLQLQSANESHIQKMAASEMDIIRLHNETELWLQEKAVLEAEISQLLEEKAALDLKGANLEENIKALEKEKDSWILTENSTKETISILNRDITRLTMQVLELEESRSKLLQENQQQTNTASSLQLHIQNCERNITSSSSSDEVKKQASYIEDLNSQIEAASVLVEKLVMENTELVEKVNELSVILERQTEGHSTVIEMPNPGPHFVGNGSISSPKLYSLEVAQINEGKIDGVSADGQPTAQLPLAVESEDSGEILQIPLDDTDARGPEPQYIESENKTVPLTDAPLIGAPFRLISFVANYVTGADMVNNTSSSES